MALNVESLVTSLKALYGEEVVAADIRAWCLMNNTHYHTVTSKLGDFKVGRGKWNLKVTPKKIDSIEKAYQAPSVEPIVERNLVPEKDDTFVKFGPFNDLKKIIHSGVFYPTFITGLSGNG